jgi:hypothetical protein
MVPCFFDGTIVFVIYHSLEVIIKIVIDITINY